MKYKSKYKKVGVLPIRIVKSNVSSIGPSSERKRKEIQERNTETKLGKKHERNATFISFF